MPEPNETELETLRRTNSELVTKNAARKKRVTELEAQVAELQSKLTGASNQLQELTIGAPLKAMAEEISIVPSLWIEQFSKQFKLELVNGTLTLQTGEGKPVVDKAGKNVPFEREPLLKLITEGEGEQAKVFQKICIVNRASGAAKTSHIVTPKKAASSMQFGLR